MRMHAARLNKHGTIDRWKTPNPAIVVNCVCRRCNNGWMSDLEQNARPILTPLIDGTAKKITFPEQMTIAAWATKCAIAFDGMESGESFYEQSDRLHFREDLIPPIDYTEFWVGHYAGPSLWACTIHGSGINKVSRTPNKSYVQTMIFGRFILQFVSIRPLTTAIVPVINIQVRNGPWTNVAVGLFAHNGRSMNWPPEHSFDNSSCTFQDFADRFGLKGLD